MHIVALIFVCVAALITAGFLYQWIGALRDRRLFSGSGQWVEIENGCRLYLLQQGSGHATVLFESGIAATHLSWCGIQETVSRFTHAVSYDRAGLGWSSPANTARTPGNIATELHIMLRKAEIKPPYILVGHSFGGLVMRRFARLFPEDVAGVVLVDPMRCEEWPPMDPGKQATLDRGARLTCYAISIARFGIARLAVTSLLCRSGRISGLLARVAGDGGRHVLARIEDEVAKMPLEIRPVVTAHWSRPSFFEGMHCHIKSVPDSVREMQEAGPILGIPVILLTPGNAVPLCEFCLSQIGDRVQQVIAPASAHWIHLDEPQLVIDSIRALLTAASPKAVAASI